MEVIPDDVKQHHTLHEKVMKDRWVYVEIRKGMYGLWQTELLAQELLKNGYQKTIIPRIHSPLASGNNTHDQSSFVSVKYVENEHVEHLKSILEQNYEISMDWSGTKYVELTLGWDYVKQEVHLAMPKYVQRPRKTQHQPYPHVLPKYGVHGTIRQHTTS